MGQFRLDHRAKRFVVDVRGKLLSFAPFDMPVIQHGERQGVRYRLASFLGEGRDIVAVSDATGVEAIEVHRATSLVGAVPEAGDEHAGDEHAGDEHGGPCPPSGASRCLALAALWSWCRRQTGRSWP